jgi:hypothetical protein
MSRARQTKSKKELEIEKLQKELRQIEEEEAAIKRQRQRNARGQFERLSQAQQAELTNLNLQKEKIKQNIKTVRTSPAAYVPAPGELEYIEAMKNKGKRPPPPLPAEDEIILNNNNNIIAAPPKKKRKERQKKPSTSSWFVTVNTHVSKNELTPNQIQKAEIELENMISRIFNTYPQEYLTFLEPGADPSKIRKMQLHLKVEYQDYHPAKQLHLHGYFSLEHSTKVHLNYKRINELIREQMKRNTFFQELPSGGSLPQVHVRMGAPGGHGDPEKEYMEKDTNVIWVREEVAAYYRDLRERGVTDKEAYERFIVKSKEPIVQEGYIP